MDKNSIIKEWFYRLPNGYANAPYSKAEMDILHKVLEENKLNGSFFTNEVDQLDQAFLDAEPVQDEEEETINLREALVKLGDKTYQLNKAEVEKITSYLEKDMKKKDFSPMARKSTTAVAKRMIGKFAEDENWQQWLNTVEGVVSDKKLQKLYFTLYDITSATYTAKYIDEVLDELYSMNPKSLDKYLFSSKSVPAGSGDSGMTVPEEFYGLADIGTARGGSKGTEMGRGEFLIPFLFDRGELGGANATHDVTINGQGWHVKELKNRNTYIRLGMKTFSKSKLARTLSPVLKGNSENEFALKTAFDGGMVKEGVIEALNTEYGGVENDYDALMTIQEQLDIEMRRDGIADGGGQGVIFYVAALQEVWFVPTEDCICGGGTQGAHTVGMSHSGRPEGKFAAQAKKIG
jgi:hypothetical protein|tara:strand:+ start:827 stop:2044 length:1218 start_codon:yes stop_codon:yes gene_type:complete